MKRFNEAKYSTLMENLEAVELRLSDVLNENEVFRIDSEYFKKHYLKEDMNRTKYENTYLGSVAFITDGQHGYHEVDINSKILHLTAKNFKNWFADRVDADPLASWVHENNQRSALKVNDIVLTTRGTVGFCALVREEVLPANIDQDVARIAILKEKEEIILPEYVVTYINTIYGQDWTKRNSTGMVQQGIALWRVREMPIPILDFSFQQQIKIIIDKGHKRIIDSQKLFVETEETLLSELKLSSWRPTEENKAVKRFSKSFEVSGRLDAEYYQPKFDELMIKLSATKHKSLGSIVSLKKSIEPGSDAYLTEGIPFIRVSDISRYGITLPEHHLDRKEYDIEELKPKKDTILFSKDGSVGIAYKVEKDEDVITSSALLHLTITDKEVLPDYLTLVLNSKLTQMQAERDAGGSIIQHWRPDEIKRVLVPILPMDKQKELVKQIKESFKLRHESVKLIEIAKRAVEIAIEQDETVGLNFIDKNI
ncbi:MAG: restriction endonuclease subunit S [Cytophagales bacterium]|nr:restriction endonuclease subunit S [Cytophagales bacterium]